MRLTPRFSVGCLVVLLLAPSAAVANGFYLGAVGSRATSMGGAFIGLADDYSAVHWNPAGITQLQGTEITVLGQDIIPLASREGRMTLQGPTIPGTPITGIIEATAETKHFFVPDLFLYTDPGPVRMLFDKVGFCAYALSGAGIAWSGDDVYGDVISEYETQPGDPSGLRRVMGEPEDFESNVKGYALSPVVAKEIIPGLSLGIAGHFVYGGFYLKNSGWFEDVYQDSSHLHPLKIEEDLTGWAYGATFGVLYRANEQTSAGITVRTPMKLRLEGDIEVDSTFGPLATDPDDTPTEKFDLTLPMWVGLGVAYRDFLIDGLIVTADVQWTQWSEMDKISRIMDVPIAPALGLDETRLNWDDTVQTRIGFEYVPSGAFSFRFGYYNDPNPSPDSTYSFVLPQISYDVMTLGLGYEADSWSADLALEYFLGKRRLIDASDNEWMQGKHVVDVIAPALSVTYHF